VLGQILRWQWTPGLHWHSETCKREGLFQQIGLQVQVVGHRPQGDLEAAPLHAHAGDVNPARCATVSGFSKNFHQQVKIFLQNDSVVNPDAITKEAITV
jgi:hypothetical protein